MSEIITMPQTPFSAMLPPRKKKNSDLRTREYLTPDEISALATAVKKSGRTGARDSALIIIMYRHGLRVSEAISLKWEQIDLKAGTIHVKRSKKGTPSVHPLRGPELRALRLLKRENDISPYVFNSERKTPLNDRTVRHIISRAGVDAGISFPVHPHMLRHATGYYLANKGEDTRAIQHYLGHRNIQHTTKYTELAPDRFRDFWED